MLLPWVELGKIDHSRSLNKVYLEGRLWLSHLWCSSGHLDLTLMEYAPLAISVISSGKMTVNSASSCLSLTCILFELCLSSLVELLSIP